MSDKMTRKDLSKGLTVLSGMRIMRDALISGKSIRKKKGNSDILRKKEKNPNKYQHLPFTILFQKVSKKKKKKPTPRKSPATGITL